MSTPTSIRAAAVQFEHAAGDKAANFVKIEAFLQRAAEQEVRLIAFPECCVTGYWFLRKLTRGQLVELAEPVPEGPSARRALGLAHQFNMTIGVGLVEAAPDGRLYNSYFIAMADGQHRCHRKIQSFESDHISSGSQYTVFDTPESVRVGVLICYDSNLVENVRITALAGAQVLLAPHQTGGCNTVRPHGTKPIDPRPWRQRAAEPGALRT